MGATASVALISRHFSDKKLQGELRSVAIVIALVPVTLLMPSLLVFIPPAVIFVPALFPHLV